MFGTYRTILAIFVALSHLGLTSDLKRIGSYSVFGFFILSGYLMTLILHKSYGYNYTGFKKYVSNRFLKLYPMYWLSILLTIAIILYFGTEFVNSYHESMYLPSSFIEWFSNVGLLFNTTLSNPRLTPPAWALTTEICFYLLMGLGLSKTKYGTIIWFVLSVFYHLASPFVDNDWFYRYFFILGASLPFSIGAMIFHYKNELVKMKCFRSKSLMYIYCILFILNLYIGVYLGLSKSIFFYSNILINAFIIISLIDKPLIPITKKFDGFLGDLSYPIYLFHYQIGFIVLVFLNHFQLHLNRPDLFMFVISISVTIIFAIVINKYIFKYIENIRNDIKIQLPKDLN